jgi:Lambda phage tail tube protein, TTP
MGKYTGKGAEFCLDTGTTTPTWTPVGQVQEIGDIAVTAEEVDVTTLDAGDYRDYIQGFKDPGEVELTVIFDPEVATHGDAANGLIALFTSGEVKDCAIRINSSAVGGEAFLMFSAFIRDMTYGALNPDDPQTITPLFRLTSPITLADTLPVTLAGGETQQPAARGTQRRAA